MATLTSPVTARTTPPEVPTVKTIKGLNEDDHSPSNSDSEDEEELAATTPKASERRRVQNAKFSAWLTQRKERITNDEVQTILENADDETLSIRSLMAKQGDNTIITTPREYQYELFERAKKQNIIAVLDTGSGKTLIAVMLLKHMIDQELEDRAIGRQRRISFFLLSPRNDVDCVTLVFQQATVLDHNLDQKIDRFCGEMGCDLWSKAAWRKIFDENMVVVCTAEILYQCLMHSYISIEEINLLIFDEAHHTKKNHAYARIIKDFYIPLDNPAKVPKIFGMTASPVDARVDVVKAAKELEAMLHCQIATTSDLSLLRNSISRPKETIAVYEPPQYAYETPLYLRLKADFKDLKALSKNFNNAKEATSHLGQWCADQIWRLALTEEFSIQKAERKMERVFSRDEGSWPVEFLNKELERLKKAQDVVTHWDFGEPTIEGNSVSSKVLVLHNYLRATFDRPNDAKCIIFVKRRSTARLLGLLLSKLGSPNMRLDVLMGSRAGELGDAKFSFRKQVLTLMRFKKGDLNCLIATSIAEEGLDIPDCNIVIRFDLYDTLIQYIQSRGRARHITSKYVHIVEEGNRSHFQAVEDVRLGEQVMREFCEALPADRLLQGEDYNLDTALAKEKEHRMFKDPDTRATLTYTSALVVLAHFVSRLPQHNETIQQATYTVSAVKRNFVCEVTLPENSPVLSATGKPCTKKSTARRSAAFEACLMLHQKGFLDGNFVAIYQKYLPKMRNALLAINSKKTTAYNRITKPSFWEQTRGTQPEQLFLTVIELGTPKAVGRDCQPLALLTRTRLPEFSPIRLHVDIGKTSDALSSSLSRPLSIDPRRLNELTDFTLSIYKDVFSKEFEHNVTEMTYWLAPAFEDWKHRGPKRDPERLIDWDLVAYVSMRPEGIAWSIDMPQDQLLNRYLTDPWDGGRKYFSQAIASSLRPQDPVPSDAAPSKTTKFGNNILDYTLSLTRESRKRHAATWCPNQPVITAEKVLHRLNLLDEHSENEKNVNTKAYICPQPLHISALPVSVVTMTQFFSAIIWRFDSTLIALEAFDVLGLKAKPELALEAVTKDSDNTEEHKAEQIHLQRGMGRNYERLEFIGDCFMKMATSISLFSMNPDDNEFEYHVRRMVMISNKNLLRNAQALKIHEYIRSSAFSRRLWYPEGIKLLRGKGYKLTEVQVQKHHLGDKTIADVCEAMIGAALVSCKDTGDMDNAVKAVTAFVSNADHNISRWADYYPLYTKPKYQLAQPTASQLDLAKQIEKVHGYRFKSVRLLRSAFIHPSYTFGTEKIPCYQRLEFLGDALLDMASIDFLFFRHPDRDPQWLTEHKMAMVSNKFLAALSVKLGFHKHLRFTGSAIEHQNREYVVELEEAQQKAKDAPDYWMNTKQPPKALSDIVEAFIGAIFVDSEYNYGEVERFFDQHVKCFFEDMKIYDTFANNHPTTYLHHLMSMSFGCDNYRLMASEVPSIVPGGAPTSIAALMVHNEIIAEGQASSSKNAKVKASTNALKVIGKMMPFEYRKLYGCDCNGQEKHWVGKEGNGVGMVGTAI